MFFSHVDRDSPSFKTQNNGKFLVVYGLLPSTEPKQSICSSEKMYPDARSALRASFAKAHGPKEVFGRGGLPCAVGIIGEEGTASTEIARLLIILDLRAKAPGSSAKAIIACKEYELTKYVMIVHTLLALSS